MIHFWNLINFLKFEINLKFERFFIGYSYGNNSRLAQHRLYFLVTGWSILRFGSIAQSLNWPKAVLIWCRIFDVFGYRKCWKNFINKYGIFFPKFSGNSSNILTKFSTLYKGINSSNPKDYTLCASEHPYATDVEWDPTGRYVVTYVSAWIRPTDNDYQE